MKEMNLEGTPGKDTGLNEPKDGDCKIKTSYGNKAFDLNLHVLDVLVMYDKKNDRKYFEAVVDFDRSTLEKGGELCLVGIVDGYIIPMEDMGDEIFELSASVPYGNKINRLWIELIEDSYISEIVAIIELDKEY